jgi:hypothetical protein
MIKNTREICEYDIINNKRLFRVDVMCIGPLRLSVNFKHNRKKLSVGWLKDKIKKTHILLHRHIQKNKLAVDENFQWSNSGILTISQLMEEIKSNA